MEGKSISPGSAGKGTLLMKSGTDLGFAFRFEPRRRGECAEFAEKTRRLVRGAAQRAAPYLRAGGEESVHGIQCRQPLFQRFPPPLRADTAASGRPGLPKSKHCLLGVLCGIFLRENMTERASGKITWLSDVRVQLTMTPEAVNEAYRNGRA